MTAPSTPVIKQLNDVEQRLLSGLLEQLAAKEPRNKLRASYYDGKRAIRQVGTIIPPQYFKLALVLGWSAKAVDILARRCNLDGFAWPDGKLDDLGAAALMDANMLRSEVSAAIVSSLIHATAFVINTRGDTSLGEPASLIHVKDARSATGTWNPRKRALDNLLSITGRDVEGQLTSFTLYLDGLTINAAKDSSGWQVDHSEHPWGVPAEVLAYKPRPGRAFGSSRISRAVMSMHDSALRTVIRMEGHADVYSFPEFWLLGADSSVFKNADGTQQAMWQTMLGRIKAIPDDDEAEGALARADVKQFSAASPQPHIDQLKLQASLFAGETDLSVTSLGVQAETNTTTADGSDTAERQLIAEAEGATDDWSVPLRRAFTRALAIQNGLDQIPAEWRSIDTNWRSPLYLSRAAQADAGAKQLGAVEWLKDTEVGLELLGLNDQQIKRALAERMRQQGRATLAGLVTAGQQQRDQPAAAG